MQVTFFSTKPRERIYFEESNSRHHINFLTEDLEESSVTKAAGSQAICISPDDVVNEAMIEKLSDLNISLVLIRSLDYHNVDFESARRYDITVKWLPGYSPHAIAEYTVALLLSLNRKIHISYERIKQGNFSIGNLEGFNLYGKTVGIIGLGRVGYAFGKVMKGFGCNLLASDLEMIEDFTQAGFKYVSLQDLLKESDIVSLHCPQTNSSEGLISEENLKLIKPSALLINTAGGRLIDTEAVIEALKTNRLRGYAADVYEHEKGIFGQDLSSLDMVKDPLLKELIGLPNVLLTAHLAFFTHEAMQQTAYTIINELTFYEEISSGTQKLII